MHVKTQMKLATILSFPSSIILTWRLATQYHWSVFELIPVPTVIPCLMAFAVYKEHRPTLVFLLIMKALAAVVIAIHAAKNMLITYVLARIFDPSLLCRITLTNLTNLSQSCLPVTTNLWVVADVVITVISWKFSVTLNFYQYVREKERASRKSVERQPNGHPGNDMISLEPEPNNNVQHLAKGQRLTRSKRKGRATT
ncbi:hypothetical protein PRIPAC_77295 [Pristionchus pacificus]|uniref:Uncharacterized protein n=1 Tax=Pristionchus pacificus TaxID=54126 RepID=A0A454Y4F6_PRIPA|nr:hypothetical protein PRIPAC_77295 [Pristionchus pacificus]|eukprot:PDM65428.1 hypothetical protein PRIPAC_52370 [Pristionchus pacificus]